MAVEGRPENRAINEPEVLHKFKERQIFAQRLLEEANRLRSEEKILGMQRIEKQIKAEMEMLEKVYIYIYNIFCTIHVIISLVDNWFSDY